MTTKELLLIQLAEECGEITQVVSKIFRFGMDENRDGQTLSNKQRLVQEIVDLHVIIDLLESLYVFDMRNTDDHYFQKLKKVKKYLELSRERGLLNDNQNV